MPMSCSLAAMRLVKSLGTVGAVALIVATPGPAGSRQLPPHAEPWLSLAQAGGARSGIVLVDAAAASGFPDAASAGVPPGTTLEAYSGPMEISEDGTVIENAIINGSLRITADNVVIKNSVIKYTGTWGIDAEGAKNVTIQNNDITGPGYSGTANAAILGSGNFSGNDISRSENGIVLQGGASTVKGNYIHDLEAAGSDPHYDGISVQGGQNGVLIEGNTVIGRDTSDVFIKNDFGPIANVKVTGNLLLGDSGYPIYVDGRANGGPITGVTITNNHLEMGGYGYYSVDSSSPTISDNVEYPRNGAPAPGR
ncbi:right-handed parallel beta-helix repeat-containing protein [Rhizobium sp. GN54]|uniref:right-handed parallel beta-helix repeat-containing protein n=1 Tax=Rhizobium sp. GN54 TaxID=2898150 RepID=UPI001E45D96D|nr:right-handed parallel beta-helix repeat-containing protein [Rhizobium sp. GN54]MCD2182923.1 right-handed parallel beta-helix repeat-containing protein [Rhizobium sp. GN54]